MGIHRSIAGLGIGGSIDIGDALASLRSLAVLEEDPYIPEVLVRMRMAWALRRDQPSIRINGLNYSVQAGVRVCRYFFMQFSPGLRGAEVTSNN